MKKIFIVFQIAGLGFSILGSWFQFLLQRKMTIYTESRLYLNVLHIPPKGTTEKSIGMLLNLFSSDLGTMTGIYTAQIPSIITAIVMMIVLGLRLFQIDVFLFCLTLIVSVIPVFLAKYFGEKQAEVNKEQKKQQDLYTLFMTESIQGLQGIKNYASQKFRALVSSAAETYKGIIISFVSVERLKTIFDERQKRLSILKQ